MITGCSSVAFGISSSSSFRIDLTKKWGNQVNVFDRINQYLYKKLNELPFLICPEFHLLPLCCVPPVCHLASVSLNAVAHCLYFMWERQGMQYLFIQFIQSLTSHIPHAVRSVGKARMGEMTHRLCKRHTLAIWDIFP